MTIYSFLEKSAGIDHILQAAVLAVLLLLFAGWSVRRSLAASNGGVIPDQGVTVRNVIEVVFEGLANLGHQIMGEDYRRWMPLVGAVFFFLLVSNLLGLIPGVGGATNDIAAGFAWAIIVFCVYNWVGIRKHGAHYIYQFMGPSLFTLHLGGKHYHVRALAPLMMLIEIPLHVARIFTLAIRLAANMFADHTVVAVWLGLVPILIPAVFMGLGVVICFIQAFVFSLLTMIYIGLALQDAH
jgi:F-type H+-transporting ATPase subunit a